MSKKPTRTTRTAGGAFVLGRAQFSHISAVEGVKLPREVKGRFRDFDRRRLSAEERRRVIKDSYGKIG